MCACVCVCVICVCCTKNWLLSYVNVLFFDYHKDSERQARLPTYDLEHFEMKTAPIGISFDVVAKYWLHTNTYLWDKNKPCINICVVCLAKTTRNKLNEFGRHTDMSSHKYPCGIKLDCVTFFFLLKLTFTSLPESI